MKENSVRTSKSLSSLDSSCTVEIHKISIVSWGRFATGLSVALSDLFCSGHRSNLHVFPSSLISVFSINYLLISLSIFMSTCTCVYVDTYLH